MPAPGLVSPCDTPFFFHLLAASEGHHWMAACGKMKNLLREKSRDLCEQLVLPEDNYCVFMTKP